MTGLLDTPRAASARPRPAPPLALIAELTHRCPLQCVYCSNPVQLLGAARELGTEDWRRVLREAEAMGVLQVLYTGGEPLLRPDLSVLLRAGRALDLYQTLITSGVGLSERRLHDLLGAGLDAVQLSLQSLDDATARRICGGDFLKRKHEAAALIRASGTPLVLNAVLHRLNLGEVGNILQFALDAGAERLELANSQYYGWALENRAHLLPDAAALRDAEAQVTAFRAAHPQLSVQWVVPDYHDTAPKPCMGGWAQTHLIVGPDGRALPCPAAYVLPDHVPPNVSATSLEQVWYDSALFQAYRGTDWMREPCRTCPQREVDHGGCRCQAFLLTGDARNADPVCTLSPHRDVIDAALDDLRRPAPGDLRHRPRTA